ncbi:MAG: hypothetical protein JWO38_4726 [Gemmataceae bacterium]|nr:hypothetical protein [Gemmataceae bacterium]
MHPVMKETKMVRRSFVMLAVLTLVAWTGRVVAEEAKEGTHEGKVVKVADGKLTMTDKDGKKQHTHAVAADAKITCDGKECKLEDLKKGSPVTVTAEKKGDKVVVIKIDAKKSDN